MKPILNISLITLFSVFTLSACMQEDSNTEANATEQTSTATVEKAKTEQQSSDAKATKAEEQTAETSTDTAQQNESANAEQKNEEAATTDAEQQDGTVADMPTGAADASDQTAAALQFFEGQHYRTLNFELPTEAPAGKIEVTELFWYGCPHCFHLEPTMKEYQKEKGDNVYFRRVPATLGQNWSVLAKAYYIGRLLDPDGAKNLHDKIFDTIHKQHRRLSDEEAVKNFFISQGFSEEEVNNAANSMEVQAKLKMATDYSTTSQASGVPTLIVNGKYMTSPTMAQGAANLKLVLKFLVDKSAKEQ